MNTSTHLKLFFMITVCLFASPAFSCWCHYASLEDEYERVGNIVVASKGSCVSSGLYQDKNCLNALWNFEIVEVLKGSSASNRTFRGGGNLSCGPHFSSSPKGTKYLLFISGNSYLNPCSSGQYDARKANSIRKIRDGVVDDLSGPWVFSNNGFFCNIDHSFNGGSLRFSFQHTKIEGMLKIFESSDEIETSVSGPQAVLKTPMLGVSFGRPHGIVADSTFVQTHDAKWELSRQATTMKDKVRIVSVTHREVLVGDKVLEILNAIGMTNEIEVIAMREDYSGYSRQPRLTQNPVQNAQNRQSPRLPIPLDISTIQKNVDEMELTKTQVRFGIKTSRMDDAAGQFLSCVESASN